MVFGIVSGGGCRCCSKTGRTGDMWHCKECWDEHHNGKKDNDWEDEETFRRMHPNNGYIELNPRFYITGEMKELMGKIERREPIL